MIPYLNTNRGLVKIIILVVALLLVLAYFNLNLRGIVNSPTFQDNWALIRDAVVGVWNKYLARPANYLWNSIFVPLIWDPAVDNLEKMKNGEATDLQTQGPRLN